MPSALPGFIAAMCAFPAAGQPLTIMDLAPEHAAVILGVDSVDNARAAFSRTDLKQEWWDSAEVQAWLEKQLEEASGEFREQVADFELDLDDLEPPTGMAGVALWVPQELGDDDEPQKWEYFVAADFGEHIDATLDILEDTVVQAEEAGKAWFEDEPFAGGTIWIVERPEADDEAEEDQEDWEREEEPPFDTEQLFLANHGSHLMLASDLRQIESALERIAGEGRGDASARSAAAVTSALADAGGTGHGYAVANFRPLIELLERTENEADEGALGGVRVSDILQAAGLHTARSIAFNIEFDSDAGMVESGFAAMLPDKEGLLSLMDPPAASFTPPAYVTADASSVSMFHFEFARLFPVVNEIVGRLPDETSQGFRPQLQLAQGFVEPVLSQLGPKIYTISRIRRPFTATSQRTLVAIECADTQAFGRSIQQVTALIGANLEQRTFLSSVIYDLEGPSFAPGAATQMSIGLGTGAVLIGDTESVEVALRLGGDGGDGTLASEERFLDAMAIMPQTGLSFGYSQMRESVEYSVWTMENTDELMDQQIEQMLGDSGMTPEEEDEFREAMRQNGAGGD
ncbi:MAG: hypothetical protein AAGF47_12930, partial [Planctomycetota bacterium]